MDLIYRSIPCAHNRQPNERIWRRRDVPNGNTLNHMNMVFGCRQSVYEWFGGFVSMDVVYM